MYEDRSPKTSNFIDVHYRAQLIAALSDNLDFHNHSSREFTHSLHAFPAKFPPQLPRKFIEALTQPDDVVFDPMSGSGTTVLEALLAGRKSIACDIDPLALQFCRVKTTPLPTGVVAQVGRDMIRQARRLAAAIDRQAELAARYDPKTQEFIDYWFAEHAQIELLALLTSIEAIPDKPIRDFMELVFSAIIITKSGGVSLAYDLAHTRPHKVKNKPYRSPLVEFEKRLQRNLQHMAQLPKDNQKPAITFGNAQALPLLSNTVDLIVTSPPYPANAIDYMRAHKFSLVWFGRSIDTLSALRREYIGGENTQGLAFENLPPDTEKLVAEVTALDQKKGLSLWRYYSEMTRALSEMRRVLKPGKAAVVVVGSSTMRGIDTKVQICLEEIGLQIGFEIAHIGIRYLDRDKRMMPVHRNQQRQSQIEDRMHEEHVIGFYKPVQQTSLMNGNRRRDISDLPLDLAI
jgi:DNA modification methylase